MIFLVGSALCGLAQSWRELIAFRALQGLGGGGLMVIDARGGRRHRPAARARQVPGLSSARSSGSRPSSGRCSAASSSTTSAGAGSSTSTCRSAPLALAVIALVFHAHGRSTSPHDRLPRRRAARGGLSAIVLFTSLGGTTYAWRSPQMIALMCCGVVLLVALRVRREARGRADLAARPLPQPHLPVTSAIGFIVGLALFGAITYLPLYLQVVKGRSPTESGLLMTPLMAGVLVTSIVSGQPDLDSAATAFPIAGTALTAVAMLLLSRLTVGTSTWVAAIYMLVARPRARDGDAGARARRPELGRLARSASPRRARRSSGRSAARSASPRSARSSPTASRRAGEPAAGALARIPTRRPGGREASPACVHGRMSRPSPRRSAVFLAAAVSRCSRFCLTWLLREIPLRKTAAAEAAPVQAPSPVGTAPVR